MTPQAERIQRYEWLAILRRVKCNPSVKLVGFAAATYGNKEGGTIFPGIERLANVTNQDDRTVKHALAWLRDHGLLHRTFEGSKVGRGGGKSDEHVLTIPSDISVLPLLPVDESDPDRDTKRTAARAADVKRKQRKPAPVPTEEQVISVTGTGVTTDGCSGPEQVISDPEQVISSTGTGDLSSRIPVDEITPPLDVPLDIPQEDHPSARNGRAPLRGPSRQSRLTEEEVAGEVPGTKGSAGECAGSSRQPGPGTEEVSTAGDQDLEMASPALSTPQEPQEPLEEALPLLPRSRRSQRLSETRPVVDMAALRSRLAAIQAAGRKTSSSSENNITEGVTA